MKKSELVDIIKREIHKILNTKELDEHLPGEFPPNMYPNNVTEPNSDADVGANFAATVGAGGANGTAGVNG